MPRMSNKLRRRLDGEAPVLTVLLEDIFGKTVPDGALRGPDRPCRRRVRRFRRVIPVSLFPLGIAGSAFQSQSRKRNFQKHPTHPSQPTPAHMQQGFRRRRVTRRASSRPGARQWSGFSRPPKPESAGRAPLYASLAAGAHVCPKRPAPLRG